VNLKWKSNIGSSIVKCNAAALQIYGALELHEKNLLCLKDYLERYPNLRFSNYDILLNMFENNTTAI
jgi:hypothetical protein